VWDALVSLDSETLLRVFTGYYGTRIFDDGFAKYLVDEGFMEPAEEDGGDDNED
jgi:hypothetical protein